MQDNQTSFTEPWTLLNGIVSNRGNTNVLTEINPIDLANAITVLQNQLQTVNGRNEELIKINTDLLRKSQKPILKINPPDKFEGKRNGKISINDWLFQVDQYFLATELTDEDYQVRLAASLLRDNALMWWKTVNERNINSSQISWNYLKELLIKRFQDPNRESKARDRIADLKQQGSVALFEIEYVNISGMSDHEALKGD